MNKLAKPCKVASVAPNEQNTFNKVSSKLKVVVETDSKKKVTKEEVVLLLPIRRAVSKLTDDSGAAEFELDGVAPGMRVYAVLPNVLEAWPESTGGGEPIHVYPNHKSEPAREPVSIKVGECSDDNGQVAIHFRNANKDKVAQLIDPLVTSSHRSKDATKYSMVACKLDESHEYKIVINCLTEAEKFLHFKEVFHGQAAYARGKPRDYFEDAKTITNRKSKTKRIVGESNQWRWGKGAVCNQFANFFLGYWTNHNKAFVTQTSATTFLDMMENSSNTKKVRKTRIRGFSDVCKVAITADAINQITNAVPPTEAGIDPKKKKRSKNTIPNRICLNPKADNSNNGFLHGAKHANYDYIVINELTSHPVIGKTRKFENLASKYCQQIEVWDKAKQKFKNDKLMEALEDFNVYSITDYGKTKKGLVDHNVDHHGGLLVKTGNKLKLFAADGGKAKVHPYFIHNEKKYQYPSSDNLEEIVRHFNALNRKSFDCENCAGKGCPKYVAPAKGSPKPKHRSDCFRSRHRKKKKYTSAQPNLTRIVFKSPDETMARKRLRLRIWPIKSLREGGYAGPADGTYQSDGQCKKGIKQATLSPDFHQNLSRFIRWIDSESLVDHKGGKFDILPTHEFLKVT
jgi:hypothetical protein